MADKAHFVKDIHLRAVRSFKTSQSSNLTTEDGLTTNCAILTEETLDLISFGDLNMYGCTIRAKNVHFYANNSNLEHGSQGENYFYMYSTNSIHITNKEGMSISALGLSGPLDVAQPIQYSNKVVITHEDSLNIYTSNVNDFKSGVVTFIGEGGVEIFYSAVEPRDL